MNFAPSKAAAVDRLVGIGGNEEAIRVFAEVDQKP